MQRTLSSQYFNGKQKKYMFLQTLLSKATYIAMKAYILAVHAFPGNQTHNLAFAGSVLCSYEFRNASPLL